MGEYDEIIGRTDEILDDMIESHSRRLERAIRRLEQRMIDLLPDADEMARMTLAQAKEIHKQLVVELENTWGAAVYRNLEDYAQLEARIAEEAGAFGLSPEFSRTNKEMFEALKATVASRGEELGRLAANEMAQGLYDAVAGATDRAGLIELFRETLTGFADSRGRPLSTYASTFAHDSIREYYARLNLANAKQAGLKHFIFYGNVIGSSRSFCIARAGQVFSEDEIEAWNDMTWKGKKRGNVWVNRGGYNCRHHFRPVDPKWIEDGKIETESYFDENPDEYTPKLRAEVEAEQRRMR